MTNFNNHEYEALATDIVGDIFCSDSSNRSKIANARSYAELILRKILNIAPSQPLTLGATTINRKIKKLPDYEFLDSALQTIRSEGNTYSHTQEMSPPTEEDLRKIIDCLFDMLSYPLIVYFEKYEFGLTPEVLTSFSLLPPIIRYKVLSFLHKKYPSNIFIIDKLALAILKAFDAETAEKWVESKKDSLIQMKAILNPPTDPILQLLPCPDMYHLCREKIETLKRSPGQISYSDFESALPHYKKHGILSGDNPEITEFNDIMDFLYLGRRLDNDIGT